ncbi:MAG: hypothetical protein ABIP78_11005 [Pyrinomonadaceae bacterium]
MLTALSFDDLAIEAENAGSFDQLIESEFFSRLRLFKESISELFYAPNAQPPRSTPMSASATPMFR